MWGPEFYIYCSLQRGQFAPRAAADRPKYSENFPMTNCECWGALLQAKVIGQMKLPMTFHQRGCVSRPALTRAVEKILEIPSFDKKFSCVPSKIFFSQLHSIKIQLIPVFQHNYLHKAITVPIRPIAIWSKRFSSSCLTTDYSWLIEIELSWVNLINIRQSVDRVYLPAMTAGWTHSSFPAR